MCIYKQLRAIIHQCPNFNFSSPKPRLPLWHEKLITYHRKPLILDIFIQQHTEGKHFMFDIRWTYSNDLSIVAKTDIPYFCIKIRGVVIAVGGIAHEKNARSGRTAAMRSGQKQTGHQFHQNKHKRVNMRIKRWFLLNWWKTWLWIYTTGMEIVQRTSSKSDDVRSPCC